MAQKPDADKLPRKPYTLKQDHTHRRVFHKAGATVELTEHQAEILRAQGVI